MHKIHSCVDFQNHRSNTKQFGICYRFPSDMYLLKYLLNSLKEKRTEKVKRKGKNDAMSKNLISVGSVSVNATKWNKLGKSLLQTVSSDDDYFLNLFLRLYFITLLFTLNPGYKIGWFASVRCGSLGKIKSFHLVP